MLTFLFWNLRKERQSQTTDSPMGYPPARAGRITEAIVEITSFHDVDVLLFAEMELSFSHILNALRAKTTHVYHEAESDQCTKIKVFTRFSDRYCLPIPGTGDARCTFRQVNLPTRIPFLMIAAHFEDKSHSSEFSRSNYCQEVARNIDIAERTVGYQRTVLAGDLNMNPYEAGITGGLHAVMTRSLAYKNRDRDTSTDTRFYNPMWQHFGETNGTPAGTYYRVGTEDEHFWNIYDQVLVRPALLPHFADSDVQVLASAGRASLLTKDGVPRKQAISDHLPVLFRLNL
jgi:hypothetical protein